MRTKILFVLLIATFLGACASVGNDTLRDHTEESVANKITNGVTTKSEIRNTFGSPLKTSFTDGGLEVWTFQFEKVTGDAINYVPVVNLFGSSASGTKKELVVLFDANDVVLRHSMSESDVKRKTGLFNM